MLNPSAAARLGEQRHRSSPSDPTPREIEDHVFTGHARFRSWCAACARGRGRADTHRGDGSQGGRGRFWNPRSVMGFVFLSRGVSKTILPHLIPAKGVYLPACEKVADMSTKDLDSLGYHGVVFRCRDEPSILALLRKQLQKATRSPTVLQKVRFMSSLGMPDRSSW